MAINGNKIQVIHMFKSKKEEGYGVPVVVFSVVKSILIPQIGDHRGAAAHVFLIPDDPVAFAARAFYLLPCGVAAGIEGLSILAGKGKYLYRAVRRWLYGHGDHPDAAGPEADGIVGLNAA